MQKWCRVAAVAVSFAVVIGLRVALAQSCDDGNKCTSGDRCWNGECMGTPVACPDIDGDPCTQDFCDPATGACGTQAKLCNDGNPCTLDACKTGVGCQAIINLADGTDCTDAEECTTDDKCSQGLCVGTNATDGTPCETGSSSTCTPECNGGVCVASANNGELCDDGLTCTDGDTCSEGECAGTSTCTADPCAQVSCSASGCAAIDKCAAAISECGEFGACDPSTGECLVTPINEGATCDDSNQCTAGDRCLAGFCEGIKLGVAKPAPALSLLWLGALASALSMAAVHLLRRSRTAR